MPKKRRECDGRYIEIIGAKANNLKNIDVKIPLGVFTVVTGVSGSGKSTLINDILYNALAAKLHGARLRPSEHKEIRGLENIDKLLISTSRRLGVHRAATRQHIRACLILYANCSARPTKLKCAATSRGVSALT